MANQTKSNVTKEDMELLTFNNFGLLVNKAKKIKQKYSGVYDLDLEELISAGYFGIHKAFQKYDPYHSSKASFHTYAYMWVW